MASKRPSRFALTTIQSNHKVVGLAFCFLAIAILIPLFQNATPYDSQGSARPTPNPSSSSQAQTDLSEVCQDPALSNHEKSRRGCCKDTQSISRSESLKQYCEAFGEPILNKTNIWTQSIWEDELERRRKNLKTDEGYCDQENLDPEAVARCANSFEDMQKRIKEEQAEKDSGWQKVADLYNDLTHPLNWVPNLTHETYDISIGMGDPLKLVPSEVQRSYFYIQIKWKW